jgi:hypothetical protein
MSNRNPFQPSQPISGAMKDLIPDECLLSLSDLQSERIVKHIQDEEQRQKTVRKMLQVLLYEKLQKRA